MLLLKRKKTKVTGDVSYLRIKNNELTMRLKSATSEINKLKKEIKKLKMCMNSQTKEPPVTMQLKK